MIKNGVSSKNITSRMKQWQVNPDPANHLGEVVVPPLDKGKGIARLP